MFTLFNASNLGIDKSPFQYYKLKFIKKRIQDNLINYRDYKRKYSSRVDSNHLLIRLLTSLPVEFNGDLFEYMAKIDSKTRSIAGINGLTSPLTKGDIFEGVFYPNTDEAITYNRSDINPMELWNNWRNVAPVTSHNHPFTNYIIFDVIVDNKVKTSTKSGLANINIDLPLMAAQYRMYSSSEINPSMEKYISQIVVPNFFNSHLDSILYNKVLLRYGLIPENKITTNLPIQQLDLDNEINKLADEVTSNLIKAPLSIKQVLTSIPTLYSDSNVLNTKGKVEMMVTHQNRWTLLAPAINMSRLVLSVLAKGRGREVNLINAIYRTDTRMKQEGYFRNGLRNYTQTKLMSMWSELIDMLETSNEDRRMDGWVD